MVFLFSMIVVVVAIFVWVAARKKVLEQHNIAFRQTSQIAMVVTIVFVVIAITQILTVIPAGHVGVVDFFGTVSKATLKAGINFRNPLARIIKFSVKTQEIKETMDVPSKEGLTVQLEISAIFHLDSEKAAEVYKTIGRDYVSIILEPQFRSVSRGVTAAYEARALYTSEREVLTKQIQEELSKIIAPRGIVVENTPLRRVGLPPKLTEAIEEKLRAEQESQRMQFVLAKERQEADRKRIEAQGIADFQNIVARGISEALLRWKGIEATEKLANSPNAKVVIIGAGKDGLPIILDTK
ncbi:MAG: prohibitin family protein [Candidatus Edwardsbacteria bacterium]